MPFFLSLFVFLCGTSWFIFGLLGKDPFVAVPNGFGSGLGTLQLILYAIYHKNKGKTATTSDHDHQNHYGDKDNKASFVEMNSGKTAINSNHV